MVRTILRLLEAMLKIFIASLSRVMLLFTFLAIGVCMFLFFDSFFAGNPFNALVSLAGMLSFIHANQRIRVIFIS